MSSYPPDPLRQLSTLVGEPTEVPRPLKWFSTRNQRIQARIIHEAGYLYKEIAECLQLKIRQVGLNVGTCCTVHLVVAQVDHQSLQQTKLRNSLSLL